MNNFIESNEFLEFCHSAFDNVPIAIDFLDKDGRMIYINKAFSDFLKIPIENMVGKLVTDINPTSKFLDTLSKKKADIAIRHKFPNNRDAICHRIPIYDNEGNLIGGLGMLLFEKIEQMQQLLDKCNMLDKEIKLYKNEIAKSNRGRYNLENILGASKSIENSKNSVKKVARVPLNVLITGESGVGKELFAHAIHNESSRASMPFISINCSAIPENLLESELFGYEDGAFTGARKGGNIGKFELSSGGTIFLDEIGDMPYYMQAKILRVLQEKEIQRIGGKTLIPVDIRVVSATHKNLQKMIENGEFREDLYYRLNVLNIDVPPLRKRKDDIPKLVGEFLIDFYKESGLYRRISDNVMKNFINYDWPGNVRELKNAVEKSCVNADNVDITSDDIPVFMHNRKKIISNDEQGLNDIVESVEREVIERALIKCGGNKTDTAKVLKIPRMTLYRKINDLNIDYKHKV